MSEFSAYLFFTLDWIVGPIFFILAIYLHLKNRLTSTFLMVFGMGLILLAQVLKHLYPSPLHPFSITGLLCGFFGLLAAGIGYFKFWKKVRSEAS